MIYRICRSTYIDTYIKKIVNNVLLLVPLTVRMMTSLVVYSFTHFHYHFLGTPTNSLFNFLFTLALQYLSCKYHLWAAIFSSTSFLITNAFCSLNMLLLQHSEMINQGYPKRSCSREMLQRLKSSSISYKQERALLVSQLALSYRFYVCSLTFGM